MCVCVRVCGYSTLHAAYKHVFTRPTTTTITTTRTHTHVGMQGLTVILIYAHTSACRRGDWRLGFNVTRRGPRKTSRCSTG